MRVAKAKEEIKLAKKFDYVLYNDVLEVAQDESYNLISKFIEK